MCPSARFTRLSCIPVDVDSRSSAIPVTSIGKINGDSSSPCTSPRPGNRCRTSPIAAGVPSASAPNVAITPSITLNRNDDVNSASFRIFVYHRSVKPRGGHVTNAVSENEISTGTTSGASRNAATSPAAA